jgi:hypothetical protein
MLEADKKAEVEAAKIAAVNVARIANIKKNIKEAEANEAAKAAVEEEERIKDEKSRITIARTERRNAAKTLKTEAALNEVRQHNATKLLNKKVTEEAGAWWNQSDGSAINNPYTYKQETWITDFIDCLKQNLSSEMTSDMIRQLNFMPHNLGVRGHVEERSISPFIIIYFNQQAIGLNDDIGNKDKAHITLYGKTSQRKHLETNHLGTHITLYLNRDHQIIRFGLYRDKRYRGLGVDRGYTLENGKDQMRVDNHWPKYWNELIIKSVNECLDKLKIQSKDVPWGGSKTRKRKKQRKTKCNRKSKIRKSKRVKRNTRKH